jgi:nucleotide-binding universal stress UspA family protein
MIKTVLIHLTGTDCDQPALAAGAVIAQLFASHLTCLRVVPDSAAMIARLATLDMASSMMLGDALGAIEQDSRTRTGYAHDGLEAFCNHQKIAIAKDPPGPGGVTASWREIPALDEFEAIIEESRFHDLIVVAGGAERAGRLPEGDLGSIIVGSGRPVLLAPERPIAKPIKTAAVAWKNGPESARALTAAMPLLAKLDRIDVISASESDTEAKACLDCTDRVVQQLRWHRLNAYGHFVGPAGRTVPDALMETAHGFAADLLVMGAYGHSRTREFVFGGFTQRILRGIDLPVLLFH